MTARSLAEYDGAPLLRIARTQFRAIAAGYGGADAIAVLNAGQLSRHLVSIDVITARAELHGLSARAAVDNATDLLADAWRHAPGAARPVLEHPYLGVWTQRCLWLLTRPGDEPARCLPDLGHLHAVAAAAAIRAGLDFDITMPVRNGTVSLPTVGAAYGLGDGPAVVSFRGQGSLEIKGLDRQVQISAPFETELSGWAPRRQVRLPGLDLTIEDTDGYRDCYPWRPAARAGHAEFERMASVLREAWGLIGTDHPEHARAMAMGLRSVVPVTGPEPATTVSGASRLAYGSLAIAVSDDPAVVALLLIHEFQHMKLGGLLDLVPLHHDDGVPRHLAPWRADPRPLDALLQGTYAHLGVADFWRRHRRGLSGSRRRRAEFEFSYWLAQTHRAARTLRQRTELTVEGREFVDLMYRTLNDWTGEAVPDDIAAGVRVLVDAATVRWRLANVRPGEDWVTRLRDAWLAGTAPPREGPEGTTVRPAPADPARPSGLPAWIRDALIEPRPTGPRVPPMTEADQDFLAGEAGRALTGYIGRISRGDDTDDAWVGLALALSATGAEGAGAMLSIPETVRALHASLRGPAPADPALLAGWLVDPPVGA